VVQAGSSDDGRDLAAETAEVIFTATGSIAAAREFYGDIHKRMAAIGRDENEVKIMPGMFVTVGRTAQEAQDKHAKLQSLIHPDMGRTLLSKYTGFDLTKVDVEGPLPDLPEANSRAAEFVRLARRDNLTVRQLYEHVAGSRGHFQIVGTAAKVADAMEEWFTTRAADGFNVMLPYLPASLNDFVALVIPELQRRGLFRTAYEGRTLRENLGLKWPESRYARPSLRAAE
jgi:alkanesulfonate monooxygenase SsuD/methylene tetrahydromethanopterin reductase-like flavin-dependent oxidoreductase (luciferase family)